MMPMLWWGYSVSAWVPTLILLSGSRRGCYGDEGSDTTMGHRNLPDGDECRGDHDALLSAWVTVSMIRVVSSLRSTPRRRAVADR